MTEAQVQALFDAIEGLRQQLSTFSDIVLMELEASRRKRSAPGSETKLNRASLYLHK